LKPSAQEISDERPALFGLETAIDKDDIAVYASYNKVLLPAGR